MLLQQILGNTQRNELATVKLCLLINSKWVENVSNLNLVVLKIGYDIGVGYENFNHFVTPLDHFKVLIVVTIQIHVEGMIVSGYDESLKEFIEDWSGKTALYRVLFLNDFIS
jgi:hypothetical protein